MEKRWRATSSLFKACRLSVAIRSPYAPPFKPLKFQRFFSSGSGWIWLDVVGFLPLRTTPPKRWIINDLRASVVLHWLDDLGQWCWNCSVSLRVSSNVVAIRVKCRSEVFVPKLCLNDQIIDTISMHLGCAGLPCLMQTPSWYTDFITVFVDGLA